MKFFWSFGHVERTIFTLLLFLISASFMILCMVYSDNDFKLKSLKGGKTNFTEYSHIDDLLQDMAGEEMVKLQKYADKSLVVFLIVIIAYTVFQIHLCASTNGGRRGSFLKLLGVYLRQVLFILSLMYLMRGFMVMLTRLPPSSPSCRLISAIPNFKDDNSDHGNFQQISKRIFYFLLMGKEFCTDMMFSGHTAINWLFLRLFYLHHHYQKLKNDLIISRIFSAWAVLNTFSFVLTRIHYSIDVLVATLLCNLIVQCFIYSSELTMERMHSLFDSWVKWVMAFDLDDGDDEIVKFEFLNVVSVKE